MQSEVTLCTQTRKAKREAEAAREEAAELGQRLAAREKRAAELEARWQTVLYQPNKSRSNLEKSSQGCKLLCC
jgi:hypothetical protein